MPEKANIRGWRHGHSRPVVWGAAAALTLLPLLAIRGVDPAAWDPPGDVIFLGILLAGIGAMYEAAVRVPARLAYRAALAIALAAAALHIWINLAVGIIGSEDNPANGIYVAVLAVAALGAVAARFRPLGMARAMAATAVTQAFVFIVALVAGLGFTGPITTFFVAMWLVSASLFARAAQAR